MKPYYSFAEVHFDALKEVGNIGAGHAATALSELLKRPVDMKVPSVRLIPFDEVTDFIGGPEQLVLAVFLRIEGDIPGNMFFLFKLDSAKKMISAWFPAIVSSDDTADFSDMERSALNEIGNILAGSYLSSLSDLTKLSLSPSVPSLTIDMAGAIISYGLLQMGEIGDLALVIDTHFFEGNQEIEGHFFLIPDPGSFETLFHSLGVR